MQCCGGYNGIFSIQQSVLKLFRLKDACVYVILLLFLFFFIVNWMSGKQFYRLMQIGDLSVLLTAAGDAELNYPIQDTQEPGLMLCTV